MPYVVSRDARIYYEVKGEGSPLVLVEGLGYAMWMWIMQLEDLSKEFKLIVFDNRGVGKSDKPPYPYTMDLFAEDLKVVLDANTIERAHILGVSMGGMIAQQFAIKYPSRVKSLILVATHHGGDIDPPPMETIQAMFGPPPSGIKDERELYRYKMKYAFSKKWYDENQDILNRLIEHRISMPQSPEAYLNQAYAVFNFNLSNEITKIAAPTLIIHGDEDIVVPVSNAYKLHKKIASSTLLIFRGAGHLVNIERASEFNKAVKIFIDLVEMGVYRPVRNPIIIDREIDSLRTILSGGV